MQILRASAADEWLYFEVLRSVPETQSKQVTVEINGQPATQEVTFTVMKPISETMQWPLAETKVYRGDRTRVKTAEVAGLLAEAQYVLVCWPGEKLPQEWVALLRPQTLVVFLSAPQLEAAPAPAPVEIAPQPAPAPVETVPQPAIEAAAPVPVPVEPVPQPATDVVPVPVEGGVPQEALGPPLPPALSVAKVEEDSLVMRSVSQYEFTTTVCVNETDAEGRVVCRPVLQTTRTKTEMLTRTPLSAIHAWETDGTEVDAEDLAARLKSYTGVLTVSSAEPVAEEFLNLFQAGVLVIQAPGANAMPAMPAPVHEGAPQAPSEEGAPQA